VPSVRPTKSAINHVASAGGPFFRQRSTLLRPRAKSQWPYRVPVLDRRYHTVRLTLPDHWAFIPAAFELDRELEVLAFLERTRSILG